MRELAYLAEKATRLHVATICECEDVPGVNRPGVNRA
jgi:hypothetical protein